MATSINYGITWRRATEECSSHVVQPPITLAQGEGGEAANAAEPLLLIPRPKNSIFDPLYIWLCRKLNPKQYGRMISTNSKNGHLEYQILFPVLPTDTPRGHDRRVPEDESPQPVLDQN